MIHLSFIQIAYAHEEGATTVTADNTLGPILALAIIILAIVVARRINPVRSRARTEGASPEDRPVPVRYGVNGAATSNGVKSKKENNLELTHTPPARDARVLPFDPHTKLRQLGVGV